VRANAGFQKQEEDLKTGSSETAKAPLHGVSGATRPHTLCPQRHCASIHRLIQWRVTEFYGRNGVGGSEDAAKIVFSVYSGGSLTEWKCRDADSQAALQGAFWARRPHMMCPQNRCAITSRLITWRVIKLYGARWRRHRRSCRGDGSSGFPQCVIGPCLDFFPQMPIHMKGVPHSTVLREFGDATLALAPSYTRLDNEVSFHRSEFQALCSFNRPSIRHIGFSR